MSFFFPKTPNNTKPQYTGLQVQTSTNSMPIPILLGTTSLAPNIFWYDNFTTVTTKEKQGGKGGGSVTTTNYSYTADVMMGVCEGPIFSIPRSWADKEETTPTEEGLTVFTGENPQEPWPYLVSNYPTQALSYNGTAYVAGENYALTDAAGIRIHNFETVGYLAGTLSDIGNTADADVALCIQELLTNPQWGAYFPEAYIHEFYLLGDSGSTSYQCYCKAMGFGISPAISSQEPAADIIQRWLEFTNATVVWSDNVIKFIPFAEEDITGNGFTWDAQTAPLYNLTDEDFVYSEGEDPVRARRIDVSRADNILKIEIKDASNQYSVLPVECRDESAIQLYGNRPGSTIQANEITNIDIASLAGQLILQRKLYIRNEYEFTLSWEYCLLEPMDVVTITDAALGLSQYSVRIIDLEEDDEGNLLFTAEDLVTGLGQPTVFPKQQVTNNPINFGTPAPNVNTPMIFEATPELTGGDAEIWVAASGNGSNWGGAQVWVSTDNTTYAQWGTLSQPATQGELSAGLPDYGGTNPDNTNTAPVDLSESGGTMLSASSADAQAGVTMGLVNDEVFSYKTANLTAANEYDLTELYRGQFGTEPAAHSTSDRYCRLDDAVERIVLPNAYIGQLLYIKFVSFNEFGLGLQDISTLTPYNFTPQGTVAGDDILTKLRTGIPVDLGTVSTGTATTVSLGSPPVTGAPITLGGTS